LGKGLLLGLLAVCVGLGTIPAQAEIYGVDYKGLHAGVGLSAAMGTFHTNNSNFGVGGVVNGDKDNSWFEVYIMPSLNMSYDTGKFGTFYGEFSYVGTQTFGGVDPIGFSTTYGGSENPGDWESELFYAGWKSGNLIPGLPENVIDISYGEQVFSIGDGFLIADAEFDGAKGCYWIAPHKSFRESAILKVNTEPVRADFFYLKSDKDYADTELYGVNVEYIKEGFGTLGASWMTVTNANEFYEDGVTENFYANRDGMDIWGLRFQGNPLTAWGLEELSGPVNMPMSPAATGPMSTLTATMWRPVGPSVICPGLPLSATVTLSSPATKPIPTITKPSTPCFTVSCAAGAPISWARWSASTICSTATSISRWYT